MIKHRVYCLVFLYYVHSPDLCLFMLTNTLASNNALRGKCLYILLQCAFFIVALFYLPKIPCYGMTIKHSLLYCFRWSNLITLSKILSVILTFIIWSFLDEFINFSCMWIYFFRKLFFFYTIPPWTQPMFWDEPFLGPSHFIKDIYETFLLSRSAHIIKEMQCFVMWTPSLFFENAFCLGVVNN